MSVRRNRVATWCALLAVFAYLVFGLQTGSSAEENMSLPPLTCLELLGTDNYASAVAAGETFHQMMIDQGNDALITQYTIETFQSDPVGTTCEYVTSFEGSIHSIYRGWSQAGQDEFDSIFISTSFSEVQTGIETVEGVDYNFSIGVTGPTRYGLIRDRVIYQGSSPALIAAAVSAVEAQRMAAQVVATPAASGNTETAVPIDALQPTGRSTWSSQVITSGAIWIYACIFLAVAGIVSWGVFQVRQQKKSTVSRNTKE